MSATLERMQCTEIWGGNEVAENGVTTAGLDVHVSSQPADDAEGGGDLYFVSSCASGRITRFVLADVSGHGEQIAAVARSVRDLMRRHINHVDQTRFVETLNARFAEAGGGDLFATAVVGTYFAATGRLAICLAGHPAPLLRRSGRDEWEPVATPPSGSRLANIPLGVLPSIEYRETVIDLRPGDTVLAFTDAATEARSPSRPGHDDMLGESGFLGLLGEAPSEPDAVVGHVRGRLDAWREGPSDDDQSLLLVRANGAPSRWLDTVLAPFRLAAESVRSISRGPDAPMPAVAAASAVE